MGKYIRTKKESDSLMNNEVWGSINWLASSKFLETKGLTLGRVIIKKGMSNPMHCHPNCEEILYLLKGTLEHSIGGEKYIIRAGDTLLVEAGIMHNAENIGKEDADMIVVYSSADREIIHK